MKVAMFIALSGACVLGCGSKGDGQIVVPPATTVGTDPPYNAEDPPPNGDQTASSSEPAPVNPDQPPPNPDQPPSPSPRGSGAAPTTVCGLCVGLGSCVSDCTQSCAAFDSPSGPCGSELSALRGCVLGSGLSCDGKDLKVAGNCNDLLSAYLRCLNPNNGNGPGNGSGN